VASHELLGGLIQVYRRGTGRYWQCSASVSGRQYRSSTGEQDLEPAKQFAEDWYLGLRGKARAGLLKTEKTFGAAADQFEKEYGIITEGQRSQRWTDGHKIRIRLHLRPFFGELGLSEVTPGKVQEYRVHRVTTSRTGKAPARSTLHDEIVTLRMILKTAIRHNWLTHLPDLSPPYRTQGKIVHRPWFSPDEYKQLYTATREYAKVVRTQDRWGAEQVHDFVLFMANTGLRPDEAKNLQHRDVTVVKDEATDERILEIVVRGKRGVGFCKSMPGAVQPYQRLLKRAKADSDVWLKDVPDRARKAPTYPEPTDPLFPSNHIKLFNGVLRRSKLKLDREGNKRTAYSLRHTYICMRLIEGADIYALAKNCRTSVEMIQKFYAAHIKDLLDASAINVMRPKRPAKRPSDSSDKDLH
jgi:integrase